MVTSTATHLDLVRDFVNTIDLETGLDRIATPDELATWYSEEGLVDDLVEPSDAEHREAIAVREAVRELLLANNGLEADTGSAGAALEDAGRKTRVGIRFEGGKPVLAPKATAQPRRSADRRRSGRARDDARVAAPEGLPRRPLPRRVLRQVTQPLARVVLDGGVREPREGPDVLGQAPLTGASARAETPGAAVGLLDLELELDVTHAGGRVVDDLEPVPPRPEAPTSTRRS